MAAGDDVLRVLESIDSTLKQLLALSQQRVTAARASQPKPVAPDRDLDSQWGDPEVKFSPRDWTGPSFKGRRFSECAPEFLDLLAETFDYFAGEAEKKNEMTDKGKPIAEYKRKDAARARGWAKRIREGKAPAPAARTSDSDEWAGTSDGF